MNWLRRIIGGSAGPSESWCERTDPADFEGHEGAVSLIPCAMRPGPSAIAFAERIDVLVSGLPVARLSNLDRSIRDRSCWNGDWFSASSLRSVLPKHLPDHQALFLCLALCHPSGYVRQPAIAEVVERLCRSTRSPHAPLALQLLVLRRNDWVHAVASEASRALDRLLPDGPAELWVPALPLVDKLGELERREHAAFVESVRAASGSAAWTGPLLDGIRSRDRLVARAATRYALHSPAISRSQVVETALEASDPVVRLIAARAADAMDGAQRHAFLLRLERDAFMPVRREGLGLRARWYPDTLRDAHERLLLDPSRALRAHSQQEIAKRGGDPVAHYRAHLEDANPRNTVAALLGLAEVGQASDASLAAQFAGAPLARTRAAAVRCLGRLAGDEHIQTFVAALHDPSPRVCRAAAGALHGRVHRAGIDRVLATLDDSPPKHVRRTVLRLLFDNDQWAPLGPLVRCAGSGDTDESTWATSLLRAWFSRSAGWTCRPPDVRVDALRRAMADCGAQLNESVAYQLEFLLRTLSEA